ncbi:hypothetical protein M406DRAFT_350456 [Cryphonectria parasitica EP155]|uniref:DNA mismatch repair protein HSM3 N-terminal domain-containing protein n=1 Tax=Cryphonectria parasitica (strain ATCC 38755 / EP155) TaxID=660469 RepID=A0A9P4Y674_CRYP1|nr:uncharacterized protein M406DRAFT_350456 [Cryphonectria parasitica EP155]KAF3767231.1 hypothetical protein M406DRAFT_350456 [Cryphonectria parasitica EP155]
MADPEPAQRPATLDAQLDELDAHIAELTAADDPSQHFNPDLFDRINYQLGPVSYPDLTARFLPRLGLILKKVAAAESAQAESQAESTRGYPPPLITLTIKLLRPVPFTAALELCQPSYLITALQSPEEYINALALAILEKAAASPSDASILAATPGLLEAFLERWLLSPSVSVGHSGVLILGDLLDVDCPLSQPVFTEDQKACLDIRLVSRTAQGHGAVWRRLFGPGDSSLCWSLLHRLDADLLPPSSTDPRAVAQRSYAQGRLLRLVPRLAVLDFQALTQCTAPVAAPAGSGPVSLLDFATLHMVDRAGDELMRLTWADYVMKLVGALRVADTARLSVETLRRLVREADDEGLREALWAMPDNLVWTPIGEGDAMRAWLRDLVPRSAMRIAGMQR